MRKPKAWGGNMESCNPVNCVSYIELNLKQNSIPYDLIMWLESFNDAICSRYYNGFILKVKAPSVQQHRFVSNILNRPGSESHANETKYIENTFKAKLCITVVEFHNI
jgi:hypothetical protein